MGESRTSNQMQITVDTLIANLELALVYLQAARVSTDPETRRRNCEFARELYEAVLRSKTKLHLSNEEERSIEEKLRKLKVQLEAAGETVT